jgi:ankyrin repeat protein
MRTTRRLSVHLIAAAGLSWLAVVSAQAPSPVADAARRADREALRALLKQGADVNAAQADGMTGLHWAAERGDLAVTEMLLVAGANPVAVTRLGEYTPLHLASRAGSGPVVRVLLKAGAPASALATTGALPLHLAAASGSVEAIGVLLDAGSDVNAREKEYGQTPLIFAASTDQVEAVKLLLKRGADANLASHAIDLARQQQMDRTSANIRRSILSAVAAKGQNPTPSQQQAAIQTAREFYATGKVPEGLPAPPAGGRGGGGFGGGGRGGPDAGQAGAAQSATDRQNAEAPPPAISAKGALAPLHHATRQGFTKTAVALLEGGADINKKSADGNTPLLTALINGQFDTAMLLVERGANVNLAADSYGITPLWAVVNAQWQPRTRFPQPQEMDLQKATYLDVMKALLEAGADPDARVSGHPWYLVYTGCGNGNCGLTSVTGSTAFWRAAYGTDVDAMKLLVQYGADPHIPTMAGAARGGGPGGGRGGFGGAAPGGAGGPGGGAPADPGAQAAAGRAAGGFAGRGGGGGGPDGGFGFAPQADPSGVAPAVSFGPGVPALHAAAGVEYGEGFAGNAHRHAPDSWLASVKYLVEELGFDVNARDNDGYTPLHHAAARGDNETILYLVSKGADVKAISRRGQTTADMANGPVSRISPYPETIALLVKLGAVNNNRCQSCAP